MSNPLLKDLDGLTGVPLKDRFAEVRRAAIAAGATVEADAATRVMQVAMRNAVRAMVKGIDARAAPSVSAAAPVPTPRPQAPMRPVASPRPPIPAPAARSAAPAPKPPVRAPVSRSHPVLPVPPPIDPNDDFIPF